MTSKPKPSDKTPMTAPALPPREALRLLKQQQKKAEVLLANRPLQREDCNMWEHTTRTCLIQAFGATSASLRTFIQSGQAGTMVRNPSAAWKENRRAESLTQKLVMLHSLIEQLEAQLAGVGSPSKADAASALSQIDRICTRFHVIVQHLQPSYNDRPPLTIETEADVHHLLQALLRLFFDNIRAEEWTPSDAGQAARIAFWLKPEQIVIVAKKTGAGLSTSEVGAQLRDEIARYRAHPACQALVCFVYDPEGSLANPRGLEQELSGQQGAMTVKVLIRP